MTEPIKPALTAEVWRMWLTGQDAVLPKGTEVSHGDDGNLLLSDYIHGNERHALAALALYGQPFGFRHDQVSWLREEADVLKRAGAGAGALMCNELADTIEALLPPQNDGETVG